MKMKDYWLLQRERSGDKAVESKILLPGRNLPSHGSWPQWWRRTQRGLETRNENKKEEEAVSFHLPWAHWVCPMGFVSQCNLLWGASSLRAGQACWEPPEPTPCTALGSRTVPRALPEHWAGVENYKGHSPKKPRHLFWFSKHFINVIDNTSRFLRLACFYFWRVIPQGRLPSSASSLSILSIWVGRTHWSIASP